MSDDAVMRRSVRPVEAGRVMPAIDDVVVTEAPLELRLGPVPIAVVMRTPGDDEDLCRGFMLTEGIVLDPSELADIRRLPGQGDRVEATLADGVTVDPEQFRRNLYTTSSCGVCGKASIDAVRVTARTLGRGPTVAAGRLDEMALALGRGQTAFHQTGGLHGVGVFTAGGELVILREDVGRHNAVDKVVGAMSLRQWPLADCVLMVSGRVSFEIVQKAAVSGIAVVAGISAASSLAVELADELDMTVAGFVRPGRAIVYSGAERISE